MIDGNAALTFLCCSWSWYILLAAGQWQEIISQHHEKGIGLHGSISATEIVWFNNYAATPIIEAKQVCGLMQTRLYLKLGGLNGTKRSVELAMFTRTFYLVWKSTILPSIYTCVQRSQTGEERKCKWANFALVYAYLMIKIIADS